MDIIQEHIGLLQQQLAILQRMYAPTKRYRAGRNCRKGYNCGGSCITRRKNCRKALEGEAKNFSEWMVQKMTPNIGAVLGDAPVGKPAATDFKTKEEKWDYIAKIDGTTTEGNNEYLRLTQSMDRTERKDFREWKYKSKRKKTRKTTKKRNPNPLEGTLEGKALDDLNAEFNQLDRMSNSMGIGTPGMQKLWDQYQSKQVNVSRAANLKKKAIAPSSADIAYDDKQDPDIQSSLNSGSKIMEGNRENGIPWSVTVPRAGGSVDTVIAGVKVRDSPVDKRSRFLELQTTEDLITGDLSHRGSLRVPFKRGEEDRAKRLAREIVQGKGRSMSFDDLERLMKD